MQTDQKIDVLDDLVREDSDIRILSEPKVTYNSNSTSKKIMAEIFENIINVIFSVFLLLLVWPIILIAAILIKIDSKGPVIYSQLRRGKNNKDFYIYKLRTMSNNAEKDGAKWAEVNDTRVTSIGKFLRNTRIDELPQLLNIIKRDMNFIGPRPERPIFIKEFIKTNSDFVLRTNVRPGLTGLAQVEGGYDLNFEEKLVYDLKYIENKNITMDIYILLKTISVVFTGEGAR